MRRQQFLRCLGATIGAVAAVPWLTACGGGDDDAATGTDPTADASPGSTTPTAPTTADPVAAAPDATTALPSSLSADEIAGLEFMREEEKLAHDVYVALHAFWGVPVFANIAESETEHTTAILDLLLKHGIEDPAAGKPEGVFEDPQLQQLYDALVAAGQASLVDALKVGALIEETDIQDIVQRQALTDEDDILRVYGSLLCGSRNHLRAFAAQLLAQGVAYEAQVIPQAEWDAIAASARETCGS